MPEYVFVNDWKGYKQGQVLDITNRGTARRWLDEGRIILASNPILALNVSPVSLNLNRVLSLLILVCCTNWPQTRWPSLRPLSLKLTIRPF